MKNKKITAMLGFFICIAMVAGAISVSAQTDKINNQDIDVTMDAINFDDTSLEIEQTILLGEEVEGDFCFQKFSKENQEALEKLFEKGEKIYNKYKKEYDALEIEIENSNFDEIDAKYETLDKKTGMSEVNAELNKFYEENNCYEEYGSEIVSVENIPNIIEITDEQMKQIETIGKQIDTIYQKNASAYEKLEKEFEPEFQKNNNTPEFDKQLEKLEQKYQKLDEKTGIAKLYEQLENLVNGLLK